MSRPSSGRSVVFALATIVLALAFLVLPPGSTASAEVRSATVDDWEMLATWNDSADSQFLDIAALGLWATLDRELLCCELSMNYPFAGTDLGLESRSMLGVYVDTDCDRSTGFDIGDGVGADYLLKFVVDSGEYLAWVVATPSDNTGSWTIIDELPAYLDDSDPMLSVLGVDFPADLIGSPSRVRVDACAQWVSPVDEKFVDWLPDEEYGEAVIGSSGSGFSDVVATHPYADAIHILSDAGIINGYTDNSFRPNSSVWRQHFAKMIVLTLGLPATEAHVCRFPDVTVSGPGSLYPDNYIAVCAARGITVGTTPNTFAPEANITRAQLITMVVRAVSSQCPGLLADQPAWYGGTWGNFSADHQISAKKAEYSGLLAGLPLSSLSPWGAMPRGEVAQVLANLLTLIEAGPVPPPQDGTTGLVTSVIDGDTIKVDVAGVETRVRLIGLNTPESGEDFAAQATAALATLVSGKTVRLETDVEKQDQYSRLLAYVWVGSTMANTEIVRQGLAQLYTSPPNVKYTSAFQAALAEAQANKRGMWADVPGGSPIEVVSVHANAAGDDNSNKNDEYVTFRVLVSGTLLGYMVKDETSVADHRYRFPDRVFQAGEVFRLRSGTGVDTQTDLYWGPSEKAIWNNGGDTVYVLDPQGHVVESYTY